jgi:hypothetical protein
MVYLFYETETMSGALLLDRFRAAAFGSSAVWLRVRALGAVFDSSGAVFLGRAVRPLRGPRTLLKAASSGAICGTLGSTTALGLADPGLDVLGSGDAAASASTNSTSIPL